MVGGLEDILLFNDANFCTASSQARGDFSCLRQSDGARYHGAPLPGSLSTFYGPGDHAGVPRLRSIRRSFRVRRARWLCGARARA